MKLLVGTRKGLFQIEQRNSGWHISDPHFLGVPCLNAFRDPRDGAIWALNGHGHWGPKLYVSRNEGADWEEAVCPAFPEGTRINEVTEWGNRDEAATVKHLYTMVPKGDAGCFLMGTDPGGMFETTDAGRTWTLNESLWSVRNEHNWFEGGGGVMLHSIELDPTNPERMHIGVSCGGVYETIDGGRTWVPRNQGVIADFLPEPYPE